MQPCRLSLSSATMEAGFLGAAAAPERQVRPESGEQKRAPVVLIPPPAIRGKAEYPGVDCGKTLRAAAAAMHSERCGHGHGETMRTRTLPARSARPPHPSRTPFPTPTPSRSSLTFAQTTRVYDRASTAQRWAAGYSGALRTMRACAGRHEKVERRVSSYECHMFFATCVPRGEHAERGWRTM